MKMKKITKLASAAFLAVMSMSAFAQNDLGVSCGCPTVSTRTSVNLSTLVVNGTTDPQLSGNTHLTCDKIWVLDQKVYVPNGVTLTIDPGTVIKGASAALPANATALIVERGGKIIADGTYSCPIVFTSTEDNLDGLYSLTNVGKWGGLVILGTASNNLLFAKSKVALGGICVQGDGIGFVEGFTSSNPWNHFGAGPADSLGIFLTPNENDNSGILRYVSVRHAGAVISNGNELNGISLGSVGRGTTFEHVEVVAAADDNIEFFGGTVNVKYASTLFGDDDAFDWDLGYSGKVQFYFSLAADSMNSGNKRTTDNGFESDADDQKSATAASNHSHPVVYNVTMIGNGHIIPTADNTGPAAIHAKELTGGEIYNSVFANFRSGLHLAMGRSNTTNKGDAYDQWTNDLANPYLTTASTPGVAQYQALKVKNNTFINCGDKSAFGNVTSYPITKGALGTGAKNPAKYKNFTAPSAADTAQFFGTDGNIAVASVPGIDWTIAFSPAGDTTSAHYQIATNNVTMPNTYHATPITNLTSTMTPPSDGFFSPVSYRGAFDATKKDNWLSGWAQMQVLSIQSSNPTDINGDGITNINDFIIFSGRYGFPSN
jgi:hypothetical protein